MVDRQPGRGPINFALDSAARRPSCPFQTQESIRLAAPHGSAFLLHAALSSRGLVLLTTSGPARRGVPVVGVSTLRSSRPRRSANIAPSSSRCQAVDTPGAHGPCAAPYCCHGALVEILLVVVTVIVGAFDSCGRTKITCYVFMG